MLGALGGVAANPTQVFENLPSSLVSLASSLDAHRPANRVEYGLAFRFTVRLDEVNGDLGNWSSCAGLRYDFSPIEIRSGGEYTTVTYLPNEIKHPRIVLKRAVDVESTQAVQRWLRAAARQWITGEADRANPGGATITLYDATNKAIAVWHVVGVRPASWSGPDLDANSSKVAIETLELVHEGFDMASPGERPPKPRHQRPKVGTLSLSDGKGQRVEFANTPVSMKVERNTDALALTALTEGQEISTGHKPNTTRLSMSDLYIVKTAASDPQEKVDLLLEWMQAGREKGETGEVEPPTLTLTWGRFTKQAHLSQVTAHFVRFDVDGAPTRAKVSLTVVVAASPAKSPAKGTNPHSGGIPGRAAHTVTQGDSLPAIAHEQYGATARWRDVAEANGVDDPLRVRAGRRLFLPSPAELPGR